MNTVIKYTIFISLMLVAIIFSAYGRVYGGTMSLVFAVGYAVIFLVKDNDDDDNNGFYKLT